ncbi:DUF2586 domain-containing protein [Shewanella surugensis]|uniref:DUF2586 domain-containing protein n=1 Tax=Shewanella surugensis TaxID=212020 RepID=A0ABT0L793_9GAMM|nr:DUF2586 domain-containing protein [Shewanella surugensis]MCL1123530.1 DUF2586 domain-containing protein [Shewanella surugensis]
MALGKVTVNNLNLGQGEINAVERHFLFIGKAGSSDEASQLYSVGAQTELTEALADSPLRAQVIAAQLNAGQNWTAAVYPLADDESIGSAIDKANEVQSFEAVVICDEQASASELTSLHNQCASLTATLGRWCFALVATKGILSSQTWSEYEAEQVALVNGIAAHLVYAVPQLHGNNLGVLAGRLCNRSVSVADSPMRVATGSVMGLVEAPEDTEHVPLSLATLNTLANARFSVPQWYPDLEGTYWSDGSSLDAKGGDYQFIEHLRPVHKVSRQVRLRAIRRVGNRALNSTPNSIENNKRYFMQPLRAMSKSTTILGEMFPGEVQVPQDGDIDIVWTTLSEVSIYMVVRPYNSPKSITVNIMLDLSSTAA